MNLTFYYLAIIILILIAVFEFVHYRNVLSATVIYPIMWILAIFGLIYLGDVLFPIDLSTFAIIICGYVLFCVGFRIAFHYKGKEKEKTDVALVKKVNYFIVGERLKGIYIIVAIALIIGCAYAYFSFRTISLTDFIKSWSTNIRKMDTGISIPYVLTVLSFYIRCDIWYATIFFFWATANRKGKKKMPLKMKIQFVILIILSILSLLPVFMFDFSRNDVLFIFLPVIVAFFLTRRYSNKTIISMLLNLFVLFLIFFAWFKSLKYGTVFATMNFNDAFKHFLCYLSYPLAGLNQLIKQGTLKFFTLDGRNGLNTVAAVTGIIDRVLKTNITSNVVQGNVLVGNGGVYINVFTYYQWTGLDFGIVYSLLWQFLFGLLYGRLYYGATKNKFGSIFWYSILMYPLSMMFFEDQYFSIGQSWLILIFFISFIFVACKLAPKLLAKFKIFRRYFESVEPEEEEYADEIHEDPSEPSQEEGPILTTLELEKEDSYALQNALVESRQSINELSVRYNQDITKLYKENEELKKEIEKLNQRQKAFIPLLEMVIKSMDES